MFRAVLLLTLATAVGTAEPTFIRYAAAPRPAPLQHVPLTVAQYASFVGQFEGRRLSVYRDSRGRYTIGAGHRCTRSHPSLSNAQADQLLLADVMAAGRGAQALVYGFDDLPDSVKLIAVDMVFNLGRTGFKSFTDFRAALTHHDWRAAARALKDSDWYPQVLARSAAHVQTLESLCL